MSVPKGEVVEVTSAEEFAEIVASGEPVAVDFNASWCGPCKKISPVFEELARAYPGVFSLSVDVDENDAIARAQKVKSLPTFKFFAGGKVVEEFTGAKADALRAAYAGLSTAEDSWASSSRNPRKEKAAKEKSVKELPTGERRPPKGKGKIEGPEEF